LGIIITAQEPAMPNEPSSTTTPEDQIRALLEDCLKAILTKDIEGITAHHATDFHLFHLHSQLQSTGIAAYRALWENSLATFEGPIEYEVREFHLTARQDVAFSHSLNRMGVTIKGQKKDTWLRSTLAYQKLGDEWQIVHSHVSVPAHMQSGTAMLHLQP
jgi:ketosteroid isomerase-like protein